MKRERPAIAVGRTCLGRARQTYFAMTMKPSLDSLGIPSDEPAAQTRRCQRPGCDQEGLYPAPQSRERLDSRYWFCLEHVRAYNLAWDYFRGMSEVEIERQRREDTVWQRPSWPFGGAQGAGFRAEQIHDPFGFFSEGHDEGAARGPVGEKEKALALLNLGPDTTFNEVKARYKELAKKLHPDSNGGDPEAEERLKSVNQAYSLLKSSFAQ